jgi:hypothetical protein
MKALQEQGFCFLSGRLGRRGDLLSAESARVADMEATVRRRWHVNVALSLVVVWCAVVWFAVLYLLGVSF